MNIPFFSSLFTKKSQSLTIPDSILVNRLKSITESTDLELFKDMTIYHHSQKYSIPLMILDMKRGIFLFEIREWTYDELKNSTIERAENQTASKDTLSYQKTQNIIDRKFNELTHHDAVPIFNYLLMENLNADEYEHLDESFKELLPRERVIFSDSSQEEIMQKLEYSEVSKVLLPPKEAIIGNLLIQHTIVNDDLTLKLCDAEQIAFIESEITGVQVLTADNDTDKSSVLLLKAILERLNKPDEQFVIIKPTHLACDILRKKLVDIVEHAIVEIDLTSIMILTPLELINLHRNRLKKEPIVGNITIDNSLMHKSFNITDLILCDDSNLLPDKFIDYLIHIQNKANLLLVNSPLKEAEYNFNKEEKTDKNIDVKFHQANPHAKALQLISKLLQTSEAKNITVVSNNLSREKLNDDLEFFIKDKAILLDSSQNLINQNFDSLLLLSYADTNALQTEHLILLDLCFSSVSEIDYALSMASSSVDIVFEENCKEIEELRIKYETNYERRELEEETIS
ncbi:MAG: hypothetical protein U9Q40_09700 [Campylobacterota bacterium]|nr:hypothetical protein [Campylobacterota bacterium]